MFAVASITTAVLVLAGVRHEPVIRSWAMNPRTPARVARRLTQATTAVGTAVASAVMIAAGSTVLVLAFVGAVNQAAGAL